MIKDYFKFGIKNIRNRKLRSWLTVLGIVIGVAAIISLITVSQGMQNAIEEQLDLFGADRLIITAKGFQGPGSIGAGLTKDDVKTLEAMSEFKYVTPMLIGNAQIEYHDEINFLTIQSMPAESYTGSFGDIDFDVIEGRLFRKGDKYSAIIGYRVSIKDIFEDQINVRNKIKINDYDFKIIGVMEEIGNAQDDNSIYLTLDAHREIFDEPEKVDMIMVQAKPGLDMEALKEKIEKNLKRARDDENYQVMTAAQIGEQINQILGIIQVVLVGIAAISLLVGAIGIMNSMYTSVLERTKEIGIMKSIGAKNSDILSLFLIESAIIGFVGGIFGVLLGLGIAYVVGWGANQAGFALLKVTINLNVILFGLAFAVGLGIISGIMPARQASKLKPVDALRYE